jgi:hypothetical protein
VRGATSTPRRSAPQRLAGQDRGGAVNLSVARNARGGPGIVLASVAFDAGIIDDECLLTLVLVAVLTSLAADSWLERVVRRGRPLLGVEPARPVFERTAEPGWPRHRARRAQPSRLRQS